jgi:hypothetical protein
MRVALSILVGLVAACATTAEPAPAVSTAAQPLVNELDPAPVEPQAAVSAPVALGPGVIASNGGTYGVRTSPAAGEFPDNEAFRFEVWVTAADGSKPALERLSLTVDAAMPQHGHGMNRVPRVSRLEPGHFLVEGMYFHMTGKWELYLDITDGALTERAQYVVELADE